MGKEEETNNNKKIHSVLNFSAYSTILEIFISGLKKVEFLAVLKESYNL